MLRTVAEWRKPQPGDHLWLVRQAGTWAREMIPRWAFRSPKANWWSKRYDLASGACQFIFPQDAFENGMKPIRWQERNCIVLFRRGLSSLENLIASVLVFKFVWLKIATTVKNGKEIHKRPWLSTLEYHLVDWYNYSFFFAELRFWTCGW